MSWSRDAPMRHQIRIESENGDGTGCCGNEPLSQIKGIKITFRDIGFLPRPYPTVRDAQGPGKTIIPRAGFSRNYYCGNAHLRPKLLSLSFFLGSEGPGHLLLLLPQLRQNRIILQRRRIARGLPAAG